jgi:pyruvate,water dikinase
MNADMPEFVAPGPGFWTLDRSHYPGGTTPISEWLISESMAAGMERVMAEIGAPIRRVEARFVNGFMYTRVWPLIGGDKPPKKLPPTPLLKLVAHLHPEFRRRAKQATITIRDRPSLDVAKRWDTEIRPRLHAINLAFQNAEPTALDDNALQQHIGDLLDHLREQFELHFWLHGHDLGPIAMYLYEAIEQGLDPEAAITALAGASPSTARPVEQLCRLRTLVDSAGGEMAALDDVRSVSDEAAALLDEYLAERGQILASGYDITSFTLAELPGVVLGGIRSATPLAAADHEASADALRQQVEPDHRAAFDKALADARAVMDMRDDNGPITVEWPTGLLRRALLAAGARLADSGQLIDAEHALDLTPQEARTLFSGGLPAADEIARRAERRLQLATLTPPATLGPTEPEPPLDILPQPLPKLVGMVQVSMHHLGMDGTADTDRLTGVGIGTQAYIGRARTAANADDAIEKLEPGDVLVVRATSPAFNAVLSIAGAVVTANGGAMSHAAVLARELGIPAVVGAGAALDIPDGAMIEVDPVAGSVRVLESADAE